MEPLDAEMLQYLQRRLPQEGNGNPRQVAALALTAARRVIGDKGVTGKRGLQHDVGVVLLGRAKSMQEDDRRQAALAMNGGDVQLDTLDRQGQSCVSEGFG